MARDEMYYLKSIDNTLKDIKRLLEKQNKFYITSDPKINTTIEGKSIVDAVNATSDCIVLSAKSVNS